MKKLLLVLLFFASIVSKGQVYLQNNTDKPVKVAIAWYSSSSDFKGWYCAGWYTVDPGEKKELLTALPLNPQLYYYAKSTDGTKIYDGSTSLLADTTNSFNIKNADMAYVKTDNPTYTWLKFRDYKPTMAVVKLWTTIELNF